jgi:hypothetical protein
MSLKILQKDCSPEVAEDRKLPYTTYLVTYKLDGMIHYDLVITDKQIEIFDYYWDRYREDLISFKQSEGRTNPKLWDPPKKQENKKK